MKVSIISVGKLKKGYLSDFCQDYEKRLSKYCKLEMFEVKDEVLRDNSDLGIQILLTKEEEKIRKYLAPSSFKICLAIEGKKLTSEKFAKLIDDSFASKSHIQFIIGGSYGISDSIKKECDFKISFSDMTFPHQVIKGMLLEQIYRGFKINNNETYHK